MVPILFDPPYVKSLMVHLCWTCILSIALQVLYYFASHGPPKFSVEKLSDPEPVHSFQWPPSIPHQNWVKWDNTAVHSHGPHMELHCNVQCWYFNSISGLKYTMVKITLWSQMDPWLNKHHDLQIWWIMGETVVFTKDFDRRHFTGYVRKPVDQYEWNIPSALLFGYLGHHQFCGPFY